MPHKIILASASPRRSTLLRQIGIRFEVIPAETDEHIRPGYHPSETVEQLALEKAGDVARRHSGALVIGADTVVVLDNEILGKPANPEEAASMLRTLSGRTHQVYTGVALVLAGQDANDGSPAASAPEHPQSVTFHERTDVTFGGLSDDEIRAYISTGSPMDKAGSYGIQDDLGALFVRKIDGDYYNVVGFPLYRFHREVNKLAPGIVNPFERHQRKNLLRNT